MSSSAATVHAPTSQSIFVVSIGMWAAFAIACAALVYAFEPSLRSLVDVWFQSEEFNYGPVLPLVCGFLIWQQRDTIEREVFSGSWIGVAIVAVSVSTAIVAQGAAIPALAHYAIVMTVAGLTLATTGWTVFRRLAGAFAILLLAIPLPAFLFNAMSLEMQTLSSQIGILFLRAFGVSVFLAGNVIDLGAYKLEVAEACNGLRYLFPLLTLGFLMAYFFKVPMWKRVLLFLSAIPITILMNSARIATIGVMVDRWGPAMAQGFLHDFQGWAVFMVSTGVMVLEMILLARIGTERRPWREVFGLEFPAPRDRAAPRTHRAIHGPLIAAVSFIVVTSMLALSMPRQTEAAPARESFALFPTNLGGWRGTRAPLESVYLDALKLSDYVMVDYRRSVDVVNFYVAWYDSQRSGQSAHSPRSCLPGGGWKIVSLTQVTLPNTRVGSVPLRVNRAEIELGNQRQLMYYWFQQRGRVITNEYMVKWYLFWDALTRHRSDGALVRLTTPLQRAESMQAADDRLGQFARDFVPELDRHVPR